MHPNTIRALLQARPFVPFIIRMTSGQAYTVDSPEVAVMTRDGTAIAVAEGEHTIAHLATRHICSLEPHPGQ